jgi:hypothetical protein
VTAAVARGSVADSLVRALRMTAVAASVAAAASAAALASAAAAQQQSGAQPDDAALLQCASEQGWRGLVDALERTHPATTDEARAAFARARLRIDATDPRKSSPDRLSAWRALDESHARRIASANDGPSRQRAIVDRATDALRIGLFADPSSASACASAATEDTVRAVALLRSVESSAALPEGHSPSTPLERQTAFLHAAAQAIQVGIDRADRGGAAARDRRVRASALLERLKATRDGIPESLDAVADLAECAAAASAGDPDAARAAAVRIVYLGEPLPAMFARIFVCDALAESRMGDRALAELVQVIRVDGLSLPLRILAADAYVRLRDSLGKSSLAAPTFEAYAEVIRQAPAHEQWSARLAVIERLGPIALRATDTSWLPPEGLVARAHAQRIGGDVAARGALRNELAAGPRDRAAMATIAALDAGVRVGDAGLASDALHAIATRFGDDPAWSGAAIHAALLDAALDATEPSSQPAPVAESIARAIAVTSGNVPDAGLAGQRLLAAAMHSIDALERARARELDPSDARARYDQLMALCGTCDPAHLAGTRMRAALAVLDAAMLGADAGASPWPAMPAGLDEIHPTDAALLGALLAERARDAAGAPIPAMAAVRLRALSAASGAAPHAARAVRAVAQDWIRSRAAAAGAVGIASPGVAVPTTDPSTAQGLMVIVDAAAEIDPPDLDAARLGVALAAYWGSASPSSAAERTARARAVVTDARATRDDLLALSDALLDEAALAPPHDRAERLSDAISVARLAESVARVPAAGDAGDMPRIDWDARARMIRAARMAGRDSAADAHIRRLAALDPSLGGQPGRFNVR